MSVEPPKDRGIQTATITRRQYGAHFNTTVIYFARSVYQRRGLLKSGLFTVMTVAARFHIPAMFLRSRIGLVELLVLMAQMKRHSFG